MSYFAAIIDKLGNYPQFAKILAYIYTFGPTEVWIIIIIIAALFAFLIYRLWGAAIMWVVLFAYMISYIVYSADLFDFYKDNNQENEKHMIEIQKELNKKI